MFFYSHEDIHHCIFTHQHILSGDLRGLIIFNVHHSPNYYFQYRHFCIYCYLLCLGFLIQQVQNWLILCWLFAQRISPYKYCYLSLYEIFLSLFLKILKNLKNNLIKFNLRTNLKGYRINPSFAINLIFIFNPYMTINIPTKKINKPPLYLMM